MKASVWTVAVWTGLAAAVSARGTTHAELQAVNADGTSQWAAQWADTPMPAFTLRGVWLNDADEMVSTNWVAGATDQSSGGQFQVFIQAVDEGDRGGTALFMSQWCNGDKKSYSEEEWGAEMARVTRDADGRAFRKGDIVEVTARKALFYKGKVNVNEAHLIGKENDFDVRLVRANAGLPRAEAIAAADLAADDGTEIFDATRATGGEHWQGMRVRLDGIRLTSTNGWRSDGAFGARVCRAEDASGRPVKLRLPRRDLGPAPAGWFAVTGIVNQEASNNKTPVDGYEVFVQEVGPVVEQKTLGGGRVELSFDADHADYVLVATDDLEHGEWKPVDATPVLRVVIEDGAAGAGAKFYRLEKRE